MYINVCAQNIRIEAVLWGGELGDQGCPRG